MLILAEDRIGIWYYFSEQVLNIIIVPFEFLTFLLNFKDVPTLEVKDNVHGWHQVVLILVEVLTQKRLFSRKHFQPFVLFKSVPTKTDDIID